MTDFLISTMVYMFLIVLCLFFAYRVKEPLLKGIASISAMLLIGFLLVFFYLQGYVEADYTCAPDVYRFDDGSYEAWELLSSTKEVHQNYFDVSKDYLQNYKYGEFCVHFNNSDGGNEIGIVSNNQDYTADPYYYVTYIINETVDDVCIPFDVDDFKEPAFAGIICNDCSPSNTLYIGEDTTNPDIAHYTSTNFPSSYTISLENPHGYQLKLYPDCKETVRSLGLYYLVFLFIIVLMLALALIWVMMKNKTKDDDF